MWRSLSKEQCTAAGTRLLTITSLFFPSPSRVVRQVQARHAGGITATGLLCTRRFFVYTTRTFASQGANDKSRHPPSTWAAATSAARGPYEVWEVRALLTSATRGTSTRNPMLASDAIRRLPRALQTQLQQYVSPPSPGQASSSSSSSSAPKTGYASVGFLAYVRDHLADSFDVESACLIPIVAGAHPSEPVLTGAASAGAPSKPSAFGGGGGLGGGFRTASVTAFSNITASASPLPPPPPPPSSTANASPHQLRDGSSENPDDAASDPTPVNKVDAMEALVPYLPTFYVAADRVAESLPPALQHLYRGSTFLFYIRRFRYYVDMRIARGGVPEVRLKPGFSHARAGEADARFESAFSGSSVSRGGHAQHKGARRDVDGGDETQHGAPSSSAAAESTSTVRTGRGFAQTVPEGSAFRPPPRHSEAHLIALVLPHIPREFTPLTEVLPEVSDLISRHPSFNALLGVTGFFCKYPEYFQLAYARMRVRPYRSAPNALDDLDGDTSPFPEVFAKIWARCEAAAAGKNYDDPVQRKEASVNTSKLYALLTASEKEAVRQKCGSFPQFLRLHGRLIAVSPDNMRVHVFKPEFEKCADTILDARLQYGAGGASGLSANDPVVRIPESMPMDSTADGAVRALYDALPLTQCVPLDELLVLVPSHVSGMLPKTPAGVAQLLATHPDAFRVWAFPDDAAVTVVARAQVDIPDLDHAELLRSVLSLIPSQGGGTDLQMLLQRAPASLQRYLYWHGVRATVAKLSDHVAISGDRVIRFQKE